MWFKNLQVYRLPAPWAYGPEQLIAALAPQSFVPCTSSDLVRQGWVSPREDGQLVHVVNKQMLIRLATEKKLLPASVVNQMAKARAAELEEAQGFAPGKKAMKELKERVADELLPRAFAIRADTWTWIDPVNGWLVVDAASPAKADDVVKLLLKAVDKLPLESLRVQRSPVAVMTAWLEMDEAPAGFTVDQDATLRASGSSKAQVGYKCHTLEPEDLRRHIAAGKHCTRLAMTWNDRISFVLTESLAIKSVKPLDVFKENDASTRNDAERFDNDMMLMTGELAKMMADIVEALGGEAGDLASPAGPMAPAKGDDPVREQQPDRSFNDQVASLMVARGPTVLEQGAEPTSKNVLVKEFPAVLGKDFGAQNAAEDWLRSRGFSWGSSQADGPQAIWHGDCQVSKWRNLSHEERSDAHAFMVGERSRAVHISMRANAPAEAIEAFTRPDEVSA